MKTVKCRYCGVEHECTRKNAREAIEVRWAKRRGGKEKRVDVKVEEVREKVRAVVKQKVEAGLIQRGGCPRHPHKAEASCGTCQVYAGVK